LSSVDVLESSAEYSAAKSFIESRLGPKDQMHSR
jgi:hypothetical protein